MASELEARLQTLVENYRDLLAAHREMQRRAADQAVVIRRLEEQNKSLRAQVDELGAERYTLKHLRDERKLIRRKLESALARIDTLEQELS